MTLENQTHSPLLSMPTTNSSFFAASREVMRITPDGQLIPGENLSRDEATQETFKILQKLFDDKSNALKAEVARLRAALNPIAEKLERTCTVIYPDGPPETVMNMLHAARNALK